MRFSRFIIAGTLSIFLILSCNLCFALRVNDGFSASKKIESKYFTIFLENGVNPSDLTTKIAVPSSIQAIIKEPVYSSAYTLPDQMDLLFLAVKEIMDIRLRKFKIKVKVCKNASRLSSVAKKLFGKEIQTGGFYVVPIDTLYVDADNVNIHVLGHELSHAIQAHYFVIPPPTTLQEVLAGFVEFQLRKYTHSLPR